MSVRAVMVMSFVALAGGAQSARAELPPQYTIWNDFAAITAQSSIPEKVGIVERIVRNDDGTYTVFSPKCSLLIRVVREAPKQAGGVPIVGPSRVARVDVGEANCK